MKKKRENSSFESFFVTIFFLLFIFSFFKIYHNYGDNLFSLFNRKQIDSKASIGLSLESDSVLSKIKIENEEKDSYKIAFLGDMMFDRHIRLRIMENGWSNIFGTSSSLFAKYDKVVANLEGPITNNPSKTINLKNKDLIFTFATDTAMVLKDNNIKVLGLGNNHTLNFGKEGLSLTRNYLDKAGLDYFGDPSNATSTFVHNCGDFKCVYIGYHAFSKGLDNVLAEIKAWSVYEDTLVFVLPHWGEEYKYEPSTFLEGTAKRFIDAGAIAVIGTHSHIVGKVSWYKDRPIFFSLGNFVFDQYFSADTMNGLVVSLEIKGKELIWQGASSTFSKNNPILVADLNYLGKTPLDKKYKIE